jgi:hypothetical protein
MTDLEKEAFLAGISFTLDKLKTTGTYSADLLFAEANRALHFQPKLLNFELIAEIDKALESGGFSWPQGRLRFVAMRAPANVRNRVRPPVLRRGRPLPQNHSTRSSPIARAGPKTISRLAGPSNGCAQNAFILTKSSQAIRECRTRSLCMPQVPADPGRNGRRGAS